MIKDRPYKDLYRMPNRLYFSVKNKESEEEKDIANYSDYFEYHLRFYIIGVRKTLHRVCSETKDFKEFNPIRAEIEINRIFDMIENEILKKEYYELMKKLIHAKKYLSKS